MESLVVRRMTANDLDAVLPLAALPFLSPWTRGMFLEEINHSTSHCFVIKMKELLGDHVVGFICFRIVGDESELLNICVDPRYRRLGIGKKLMKFYTLFCRKRKVRTFFLEVNAVNVPAVHLYQLFSYESLGTRREFYRGGREGRSDALIMRRSIDSG